MKWLATWLLSDSSGTPAERDTNASCTDSKRGWGPERSEPGGRLQSGFASWREGRRSPSSDSSDSGAIMIMGVFMATFLVGMVWYVIGIGDVLLFREKMQDAADATAFASAVTHARGMNYVALINIIMAIVVAVLIVLRVLQYLFMGLKAVATALCFIGVGCGFISPLQTLENIFRQAANFYQDSVADPVLKALHTASGCIAGDDCALPTGIMPVAAQARAVSMGSWDGAPYRPTTRITFAYPLAGTLPVENDEFIVTCNHASALVVSMILGDPDVNGEDGSEFMGHLRGGLERLARAAAGSYCTGTPMEPLEFDSKRPHPSDPHGLADGCFPTDGTESDGHSCTAYNDWLNGKLDDVRATHGTDDFPDSATVIAVGGRAECRSDYESIQYVVREYDVKQRWRSLGGYWHLDEGASGPSGTSYSFGAMDGDITQQNAGSGSDQPQTFSLESGTRLPCGSGGYRAARFGGAAGREHQQLFNAICADVTSARAEDCPGDHDPANATDCDPAPTADNQVVEYTFRVRAIQEVVQCVRPYVLRIQPDVGSLGGDNSDSADKAPKRMDPCHLQLGEEGYQIRGFAIADRGPFFRTLQRNERATAIPTWGRDSSSSADGLVNLALEFGIFSVAQAEYFYQAPANSNSPWQPAAEPPEWLWHMYWTARMRRFHWRAPEPETETPSDCDDDGGGGSDVLQEGAGDAVDFLDDIIIH